MPLPAFTSSMLGLAKILGQAAVFGGGSGGGRGGHPLTGSGMSVYGPIKNLPPHMKRSVYEGLPYGGHPYGISQRDLEDMKRRNLAPPGHPIATSRNIRTGPDALRALNIKKNLDPEYLPSGELRPPPTPPAPTTGTPVDVNAARSQASSVTTSGGLQPAGANLVNLLAQQQVARYSPRIQAIRNLVGQ